MNNNNHEFMRETNNIDQLKNNSIDYGYIYS